MTVAEVVHPARPSGHVSKHRDDMHTYAKRASARHAESQLDVREYPTFFAVFEGASGRIVTKISKNVRFAAEYARFFAASVSAVGACRLSALMLEQLAKEKKHCRSEEFEDYVFNRCVEAITTAAPLRR